MLLTDIYLALDESSILITYDYTHYQPIPGIFKLNTDPCRAEHLSGKPHFPDFHFQHIATARVPTTRPIAAPRDPSRDLNSHKIFPAHSNLYEDQSPV